MMSASATTASSQGALSYSTGMASLKASTTTFRSGWCSRALRTSSKPLPRSSKSVQRRNSNVSCLRYSKQDTSSVTAQPIWARSVRLSQKQRRKKRPFIAKAIFPVIATDNNGSSFSVFGCCWRYGVRSMPRASPSAHPCQAEEAFRKRRCQSS